MPNFMYFLPEVSDKPAAIAAIRTAGLDYAFAEKQLGAGRFGFNAVSSGPGETHGAIVVPACETKDGDVASGTFTPATQTWTKVPDNLGDFWLGRDHGSPVRPVDLERAETLDGADVTLGDGNEWKIPAARLWPKGAPAGLSALPHKLVLGEDGEWQTRILPRWETLSRHAEQLLAIRDGDVEVEDADAMTIAVDTLAVNYHVGPLEVSALELLTTTEHGTLTKVFDALLGFPQLRAMIDEEDAAAKKNGAPRADDGGGSPTGEPD